MKYNKSNIFLGGAQPYGKNFESFYLAFHLPFVHCNCVVTHKFVGKGPLHQIPKYL